MNLPESLQSGYVGCEEDMEAEKETQGNKGKVKMRTGVSELDLFSLQTFYVVGASSLLNGAGQDHA